MKRILYTIVLLLLTVSTFAYVYMPPPRQYPQYVAPIRQYAAVVSSYPSQSYPAYVTALNGCNNFIVADPTNIQYMAIARKQCRENNLDVGCYNQCVANAQSVLGRSRVSIEYPAATRTLTQVSDFPAECKYVAANKFVGMIGDRQCKTLVLDCPILNGGLPRERYCSEQCKFNVYRRCQSIGTQRSPYVAQEQWAMYLRTYRALPTLATPSYPVMVR